MKKISYKGYRFPLEIIQQAIWLYVRFTLSFRDVVPVGSGTSTSSSTSVGSPKALISAARIGDFLH